MAAHVFFFFLFDFYRWNIETVELIFMDFFSPFFASSFFASKTQNSQFNNVGGLAAKTAVLGLTRRPALGDLANRAPKSNAGVVEATKKSVILNTENEFVPAPGIVDLKKVKPRVDTHWTKPITRSHSLKTAAISVNTKTESTIAAEPKLLKARTTTTASIKSVKYITTTKPAAVVAKKEKSKSPVAIKRQESNLSRKSLTKIRSATTATAIAAKAENARSSGSGSDSDAAIKKKSQPQKSIESQQPVVLTKKSHSANMLGQVSKFNTHARTTSSLLTHPQFISLFETNLV